MQRRKIRVEISVVLLALLFFSCKSPGTGGPSFYVGAVLNPIITTETTLRIVALGDAGTRGTQQLAVANDLAVRAGSAAVDFVLYLGDNFYENGVSSTADPLWASAYSGIYNFNALPRFYAIAGNHDHRGSVLSQVDYSYIDSSWIMPSLSYAFSYSLPGNEKINFLGIDTTTLVNGGVDAEEHWAWIERRLQAVSGGRIVVFGHHPVYSAGSHGDNIVLINRLLPLMSTHGVDIYLAGHDHNLEIRQPVDGVHFVISGAGGKLKSISGEPDFYAVKKPGAVIIEMSASGFTFIARESNPPRDVLFPQVDW